MNEKITITIHVTSPGKTMGKHNRWINLLSDESIENLNITDAMWRRFLPDLETMIVLAIRDYLEKNGE